jgi:hypothetical protein
MTTDHLHTWSEANQKYLMAAVAVVKAELEIFNDRQLKKQTGKEFSEKKAANAKTLLAEAAKTLPAPSALENLVSLSGLSSFERKILLMCAGVELDSDFAALIADLQGNPSLVLPTFSLAMAAFDDAHWSAISPERPLRYWRMLELKNDPLLTRSPAKIDEQVLHYLTGIYGLDERFGEMTEPVLPDRILAPSHKALKDMILHSCTRQMKDSLPLPVIQLNGSEEDKAGIAAHASAGMGRRLFTISAYAVPVIQRELTEFTRLWNREAALNGYALLLDCSELDTGDKVRLLYLQRFIEHLEGPLFISTDRWSPKIKRLHIILDVLKPTRTEQTSLWKAALGDQEILVNGQLDRLVSQFNLGANTIQQVSAEINTARSASSGTDHAPPFSFREDLWKLCCKHSRPHVDELAQRIEPVAKWDDIVLPGALKDILREIAMQVNQRRKVYEEWGFAGSSSRGLGISAMFTGESGTGKTMAAEVLANELHLDLYRIDLSQVVNKYIGETEKNLKRIFDAAEEGGAILLFDEADALFGKRSEVKDSHDRYGNIEVSYLLQRMEAYRGLAILTTNMKNALDKAFLRRIRFIVQFPFPGLAQRAEIWSKVFPVETPVANLDLEKLARLSIPGGNIRNIALNAAFIAADENMPVGMSHIIRAARTEYNKLEKAMNSMELEQA